MSAAEKDTRKALCDSFKQLIQEVPFKAITIKMIAERAGVIRPTFYNYFRDKQEVYEWILQDELINVVAALIENNMGRESLKIIFTYFEKNRNIYKHLFRLNGQNSFKEILFYQLCNVYQTALQKHEVRGRQWPRLVSVENIVKFTSANVVSSLELWLTDERNQEYSADEIYESCLYLLEHSVFDLLDDK